MKPVFVVYVCVRQREREGESGFCADGSTPNQLQRQVRGTLQVKTYLSPFFCNSPNIQRSTMSGRNLAICSVTPYPVHVRNSCLTRIFTTPFLTSPSVTRSMANCK